MKGKEFRKEGISWRIIYAVFALCMLALMTGDAWSGDPSHGSGKTDSVPACGCPDLVYTDVFKARRLGYVNSPEFADAIRAVASGKSLYSPPEIPNGWLEAAKGWSAFVAAHPKGVSEPLDPARTMGFGTRLDPEPFLSKDACVPALLYLASLEYRSRQGNWDLTPVFPHLVRTAIFDLGTQIVVKNRNTPAYAKRTVAVMAKISKAEKMGAGDCEPTELARTKAALDHARRDAAGVRASVEETDASFSNAERLADSLLTKRQYAMAKGFICYQ
jgi:hypothetical protein